MSLGTQPPPLRWISRKPHGSNSASKGSIVRGLIPDPTRMVADAGIRDAVRISVRSVGSAFDADAVGA